MKSWHCRGIAWGILAIFSVALCLCAHAQSLEELNIQIHGYATQGFLYTSQNNILTTNSSSGSAAWSEAVVNLTSLPAPKLRVGVQARYFLLGTLGNTFTLDWAAADYTFNEKLGVRFGKVKAPVGLLNEKQDIDPSYSWSLLPQSVYPIVSRNTQLSHYGGIVYGALRLGGKMGKLEYRAWGGDVSLASTDGYLLAFREAGIAAPNGVQFTTVGGALHWKTPISGLMFGASDLKDFLSVNQITAGGGALTGTETTQAFQQPYYFGKYEKNKLMVAAEYMRLHDNSLLVLQVLGKIPYKFDDRAWYGMASYKLTDKLTAGVYDSQLFNRVAALGAARYSKDWVFSGRYDFNQFLYAKAEEHVIQGTAQDYDAALNPGGLKPNTKFTLLKIGVSF